MLILSAIILLSQITYAQDILTTRSQGVGANVTVTGIVTNGYELGVIRYVEDPTAGIAIYDITANNYLANINRGDSITVSGTLVDYNASYSTLPQTNCTCEFHRILR